VFWEQALAAAFPAGPVVAAAAVAVAVAVAMVAVAAVPGVASTTAEEAAGVAPALRVPYSPSAPMAASRDRTAAMDRSRSASRRSAMELERRKGRMWKSASPARDRYRDRGAGSVPRMNAIQTGARIHSL
jgi:hypothetical protein